MAKHRFKIGDVVHYNYHDGKSEGVDYTITELIDADEMYRLTWTSKYDNNASLTDACVLCEHYSLSRTAAQGQVAPPVALDLTKPIQFRNGQPVKFIGTLSNGTLVFEDNGTICHRTSKGFSTYFPSNGSHYDVVNVPTPPLWPCKRWFVSWEENSQAEVSGQHKTQASAEDIAARKIAAGATHVVVNEVTFNGKA